jgi:hypothetical protein
MRKPAERALDGYFATAISIDPGWHRLPRSPPTGSCCLIVDNLFRATESHLAGGSDFAVSVRRRFAPRVSVGDHARPAEGCRVVSDEQDRAATIGAQLACAP